MKATLNTLIACLLSCGLLFLSSTAANAQCASGELEVTIVVNTDAYGYETYWELTPMGDACGVNTIASGGNPTMDCTSGGGQAQDPGGYGNAMAIPEGPFCLLDGSTYSIHWVDDWGDGTAGFDVLVGGVMIASFPASTGGATGTYDFTVAPGAQYNAALSSTMSLHPEYTALPSTETGVVLQTGATVASSGALAVTNVTVDVSISEATAGVVATETLGPIASIPAGGSMDLTGAGYTPTAGGVYTATYTVNIAETDEDASDDASSAIFSYESTQARDNGVMTSALGIGAGTAGQLGQEYTLANPANLAGAEFILSTPVAGDEVTVDLFNFAGAPTDLVASSSIYTVDNANDGLPVSVTFPCPIEVSGDYALVLNEPEANNISFAYANDIYTPNKTWIDFPGNPNGGWSNSEAFGFNGVVFAIRAMFDQSSAVLAATGAASNEVGTAMNGEAIATVTGGTAPYTYLWDDALAQTTATAVGLSAGSYTCMITDANGCSASVTVEVLDVPVNVNVIEGLSVLEITPNPASTFANINLELEKASDVQVTVFDITGKTLYSITETNMTNKQFALDVANYEAGVYMVRFNINDEVVTKRLVVQK